MSRTGRSPAGAGRSIGFGIHQAVELLLGVFLVSSSIRITGGGAGPVLGFGVAIMVLAAVTTGPLAAVRILSPSVHRVLDVVMVALAVTCPLLPLGLDGASMVLMVLTGLGLAGLVRSTTYITRRRPTTTPRAVTPHPDPPPPPPVWARDLGSAAARARAELPRRAGRVVGRLKRGPPSAS